MVPMCMGVPNVERVIYKQLLPGDFKKFSGQSNLDPSAGGGARDLRIGRHDDFEPVVKLMFPSVVSEFRVRGGTQTLEDIYRGRVRWQGAASAIFGDFETPQDERPNEWRFARVASIPFLAAAVPKGNQEAPELILLLQDDTQDVWLVHELKSVVALDPHVGPYVSNAFASHMHPSHAVVGYVDFVNGTDFNY